MLIGRQRGPAAAGRTFETVDPATGETLAHVAAGEAEDVDRAVSATRKAFEDGPWSRLTPSERGPLDNGKPLPSPARRTSRSPRTCSGQ